MTIQIGEVEALFRYPVKSMRGERLDAASLDWHGIVGDRRMALRRVNDKSGFPWLSASRLPELILFTPRRAESAAEGDLPTHVRTPEGEDLEISGPELAAEVGRRFGSPLQMMHMRQGIFDEAGISVIASATIDELARLSARPLDVRRFRPNIVVRSLRAVPFEEDEWVGGTLSFGEGSETVSLGVTMRDDRCAMVNLDPDSARTAPEIEKTIVRARDNKAGVYGTITRRGRLKVGQAIFFEPRARPGEGL